MSGSNIIFRILLITLKEEKHTTAMFPLQEPFKQPMNFYQEIGVSTKLALQSRHFSAHQELLCRIYRTDQFMHYNKILNLATR